MSSAQRELAADLDLRDRARAPRRGSISVSGSSISSTTVRTAQHWTSPLSRIDLGVDAALLVVLAGRRGDGLRDGLDELLGSMSRSAAI